jgi:hypothetical protein
MQKISKLESERTALFLNSHYAQHLSNEYFLFSGKMESGSFFAKLDLCKKDNTFKYAMEFMINMEENHLKTLSQVKDIVIDFIGFYLDQYFSENRELIFPLDFEKYQFGENHVFARGDILNPQLDAMADEIIEKGVPLNSCHPKTRS